MTVQHLSSAATPDAVAAVIAADGCVVIDRLASPELLDRIDAEMSDHVARTPYGTDDFAGPRTRRTGGLVARSAASRDLVLDELVLGTVDHVLAHVNNYQLHLTQMIRIEPGGPAQVIHRDQWAFDFFTFPTGYQVQCNTIWAATDFTEANGATRVVPGSHLAEDKLRYELADTEPAEMERGSVLLYVGSLYHGGGPNRSVADRVGVNITYSVGWLRQEENQFLTVPPEVARELPERLQRLLGYSLGAYALGYVDDLRDPLDVLMGRDNSTGSFAAGTTALAANAGVETLA
jgi:Protein involved in biosynthesis of mitomycin antibiotics/polyketide fumonisin